MDPFSNLFLPFSSLKKKRTIFWQGRDTRLGYQVGDFVKEYKIVFSIIQNDPFCFVLRSKTTTFYLLFFFFKKRAEIPGYCKHWRCLVKSFNERNPFEMLVVKNNSLTTLFILPVIYWRKGRITSSRHDPYGLGYTRVTMVITKGSNGANRSESLKITSVQIVLCNSRTWRWNH